MRRCGFENNPHIPGGIEINFLQFVRDTLQRAAVFAHDPVAPNQPVATVIAEWRASLPLAKEAV